MTPKDYNELVWKMVKDLEKFRDDHDIDIPGFPVMLLNVYQVFKETTITAMDEALENLGGKGSFEGLYDSSEVEAIVNPQVKDILDE